MTAPLRLLSSTRAAAVRLRRPALARVASASPSSPPLAMLAARCWARDGRRHASSSSSSLDALVASLPASFSDSALFQKLRRSPRVLGTVLELVDLFRRKGITTDRQPTFTEMMTIARDPEIQAAMRGLKAAMDEEGVSVDIQELLKNMPSPK